MFLLSESADILTGNPECRLMDIQLFAASLPPVTVKPSRAMMAFSTDYHYAEDVVKAAKTITQRNETRAEIAAGSIVKEVPVVTKEPRDPAKCTKGLHEWVEENIYVSPKGRKACNPCMVEYQKNYREANKALIDNVVKNDKYDFPVEVRQGPIIAKKTCINGHEWTDETTYINPKGTKICRICVKASQERSRARRSVVVPPEQILADIERYNKEHGVKEEVADSVNPATRAKKSTKIITVEDILGSNNPTVS